MDPHISFSKNIDAQRSTPTILDLIIHLDDDVLDKSLDFARSEGLIVVVVPVGDKKSKESLFATLIEYLMLPKELPPIWDAYSDYIGDLEGIDGQRILVCFSGYEELYQYSKSLAIDLLSSTTWAMLNVIHVPESAREGYKNTIWIFPGSKQVETLVRVHVASEEQKFLDSERQWNRRLPAKPVDGGNART